MNYEIRFSNGSPNVFLEDDEKYEKDSAVIVTVNETSYFAWIYRVFSSRTKNLSKENVRIERSASAEDGIRWEQIVKDSEEAKKEVLQMIEDVQLEMKVVRVLYSFDYRSLFISFTAESRVDFRQLLRSLSGYFQTRIELRQIGVRDAAQLVGGIGPCGQALCCGQFLYEFPSVSIKMVKTQRLSFNQSKINGMCGRLMCCLSYENDFYKQASKEFPDYGETLKMPEGLGRVIDTNILRRTITLRYPEFVREYTLDELGRELNQKGQ